MTDKKYRLNDAQMRDFIQNGYVKLQPDLPAGFHEKVYQKIEEMFETHGNLGNNILPLIPDIQHVFDHPAVHGAMTSVMGENYVMHPHRYCHFNPPGSAGQQFHKDSYEGDEQIRRHRCRWAMAFYYPQDTTEDMGPTAVLPATHYYDTHDAAHAQPELALCGEAGTVTIVHYDLWHRAMANVSDKKRYMVKFLFLRLEEPKSPSWHSENGGWQPLGKNQHDVMWKQLWDWYAGSQNGGTKATNGNVSALIDALQAEDETVRLDAAYTLGAIGEPAVPALIEQLYDDSEDLRRHATFALGANDAAVSALTETLTDENPSIRASAAYALGDIGEPAQAAVPALTAALHDESEMVRRHAAEAVGIIGQPAENTVPALVDLLRDEQYWIRDNAARSLAKLGPAAEAAIPALLPVLNDENRYVRFHAALALKQLGTPQARNLLFDHLFASRWCPLTSKRSAY
jgi:hypothetical protein